MPTVGDRLLQWGTDNDGHQRSGGTACDGTANLEGPRVGGPLI